MLINAKLNIFGISINVESDSRHFIDITRKNLIFFARKQCSISFFVDRRINVIFLSKGRVAAKVDKNAFAKIGNNVYLDGDKCIYFYGPLRVEAELKKDEVNILAQYRYPKNFREGIKDLTLSFFLKSQRNFFLLIRYLILFPVFLILEQEKSIFLLHGSAVSLRGKGVAFAGLGGIGKSLLSIALTLDHDAKFLTDNFLLFDRNFIYPFPEFLRLSDDARHRIRNSSDLGNPALKRFKRKYYNFNNEKIADPVAMNVLFLPRLSEEPYIKKQSLNNAIDSILLINDQAREFHQYHPAGLMSCLFERSKATYKTRINIMEDLLKSIDIYELGINQSLFPADKIATLIDGLH